MTGWPATSPMLNASMQPNSPRAAASPVPRATKPAEQKPAEQKSPKPPPSATKPAEQNGPKPPASATKPAEQKGPNPPASATKPAEQKPAEQKSPKPPPSATKPAEQKGPKPPPSAAKSETPSAAPNPRAASAAPIAAPKPRAATAAPKAAAATSGPRPRGFPRIHMYKPSMLSDIARAQETRPATAGAPRPTSRPSDDCCWVYAVQPKRDLAAAGEHRLQELAAGDKFYAENSYLVQRIALRFEHVLDPVLVSQALRSAMAEHPLAGSRLVRHEGHACFHLDAAEINVHVVNVAPRMLRAGAAEELLHVCEEITAPGGPKGCWMPIVDQFKLPNLIEAYLLVSADSTAGCALVAGFQHVIGDASCYGIFLRTWSEKYELVLEHKLRELLQPGEVSQGTERREERIKFLQAHLGKLPAPALPTGQFAVPSQSREPKKSLRRLLHFSAKGLESLKGQVGVGEGLSTNDILMAQFACAIAPFRLGALRRAAGVPLSGAQNRSATSGGTSKTTTRNGIKITKISAPHTPTPVSSDPINTTATIVMMADQRGRGVKSGNWGNHAEFVFIEMSFKLLMSGNIVAVAQAIRCALRSEFNKLEHDTVLYNIDKQRMSMKPKLFIWNSWARIGHTLRHSSFGGEPESLLGIDYLNQQVLESQDGTLVCISPCHTNGLTVGITTASKSGKQELDKLEAKFWSEATRQGTSDPAVDGEQCSGNAVAGGQVIVDATTDGECTPMKTGRRPAKQSYIKPSASDDAVTVN
eukprot:Tamp_06624.p1 GENE.Tamp_06624~~Tamp_06624.p1  ORF type:complete len:777 (-),score=121.62 Tamp_06624:335-2605(-)